MTMRQVNSLMSAEIDPKTGSVIAGPGWGNRRPRSEKQIHELACRRQGIFDANEIEKLWEKVVSDSKKLQGRK